MVRHWYSRRNSGIGVAHARYTRYNRNDRGLTVYREQADLPELGCDEGKGMIVAEPTFIASVDGLCGFILVVGDGEVDAYTPSGEWLGVFHDRIDAAEAVLQQNMPMRSPER